MILSINESNVDILWSSGSTNPDNTVTDTATQVSATITNGCASSSDTVNVVLLSLIHIYSTYLGGLAYDSERSKNAYRINGKYFQPQHDDYYQFPAADTIHIQTLDIINEGSHIDTLITSQTITKVDGRWWNIGGRKEGA